jgi:hypothetical protein
MESEDENDVSVDQDDVPGMEPVRSQKWPVSRREPNIREQELLTEGYSRSRNFDLLSKRKWERQVIVECGIVVGQG